MNFVLLITVTFTFALVHGWQGVAHNMSSNSVPSRHNRQPCERNDDNNAYNTFVQRHILQEYFNRRSKDAWKKYLTRFRLCNRPWQSFIEKRATKRVLLICNGYGRPLYHSYQGNLCISASAMLVYDVKVSKNCKILSLLKGKKRVIVACDKIGNRCLPVHFEKYNNQRPDPRAERCGPRA